jgi:putative transposase
MARAWRIEYEGALYHILSRGNEQRDIFLDDEDRTLFLTGLAEAAERFAVDVLAYVLMDNHYHLLLRTRRANLSKAMQWLGVSYTTRFNFKQARPPTTPALHLGRLHPLDAGYAYNWQSGLVWDKTIFR